MSMNEPYPGYAECAARWDVIRKDIIATFPERMERLATKIKSYEKDDFWKGVELRLHEDGREAFFAEFKKRFGSQP